MGNLSHRRRLVSSKVVGENRRRIISYSLIDDVIVEHRQPHGFPTLYDMRWVRSA